MFEKSVFGNAVEDERGSLVISAQVRPLPFIKGRNSERK